MAELGFEPIPFLVPKPRLPSTLPGFRGTEKCKNELHAPTKWALACLERGFAGWPSCPRDLQLPLTLASLAQPGPQEARAATRDPQRGAWAEGRAPREAAGGARSFVPGLPSQASPAGAKAAALGRGETVVRAPPASSGCAFVGWRRRGERV